MDNWLPSFFDEMSKISSRAATITWGMEHDPLKVPPMQDGMYSFGGTPRIVPNDSPGYYKPPLPTIKRKI